METDKKLARNTLLQISGKVFATIFGILTVAILARYLGTAGYGQLTIVLSFLSIFAVIVDFGLTLTTVQMISEHSSREEKILSSLISLRVLSAVLFLSLAPVVAIFFPYDGIVKISIAVGTLIYLFGTTAQMLIGIFQKRLVMNRVVVAELINRSVVFVGAIVAPLLGFGLIGIVWLFVIGNALQLITTLIFAKQYVRLRFGWDLQILREIISRSWPIGASIFFNLIYLRGDVLFLSLYRPDTEIGIYGAAYKIVDVITVIPVMYMGLILPILVAAWAQGHKDKFKNHLQQTFDFFSILAWPLGFGAIAVGVPLMELVAGSDFSQSGLVLAILGPASAMIFFNSLFGHAIVGVNRQRPMVLAYLFVAAITVAGYMIFIPTYGMWAAAWWTLISEVLIGLISFAVIFRVTSFVPKLAMTVRAIAASLIMFVALYLIPDIQVLLDIALGMVIYGLVLMILGGPRPFDIIKLFLPEKPPISEP